MSEDFLQWVWEQRLYECPTMRLADGRQVEVLNPGRRNRDAGPDFFNAQVRAEGVTWAGNVELHLTSDDWYRHEHDRDPAYNNVVLHVVGRSTGRRIFTARGDDVPEVQIAFPPSLLDNYDALDAGVASLPIRCGERLAQVPRLLRRSWLDALLVERLEEKVRRAQTLFDEARGDFDQTFFALLARALAGKVNAEPMELLARATPLKCLLRHADSLLQLEALLLGQAGLLDTDHGQNDNEPADTHPALLRREYGVLRAKFDLHHIDPALWKYARMRPPSFPDVRLAQMAALIHAMPGNFAHALRSDPQRPLAVQASPFWDTHYRLAGPATKPAPKRIGEDTRRLMVVNAIVPFLLLHARFFADCDRQEEALQMLRQQTVERNACLDKWASLGVTPDDEADAQALIHLHDRYCAKHDCLRCRFGHHIVARQGQGTRNREQGTRNKG